MNGINVVLDSTFRAEFFLTYQALKFPSFKFSLQRERGGEKKDSPILENLRNVLIQVLITRQCSFSVYTVYYTDEYLLCLNCTTPLKHLGSV